MVFDARDHLQKVRDLPAFEFVGLDGETHQLPHFRQMTQGHIDRLNRGEAESVMREVAPDAWPALAEMPVGVAEALQMSWMDAGGTQGK